MGFFPIIKVINVLIDLIDDEKTHYFVFSIRGWYSIVVCIFIVLLTNIFILFVYLKYKPSQGHKAKALMLIRTSKLCLYLFELI